MDTLDDVDTDDDADDDVETELEVEALNGKKIDYFKI